MKNETQPQHTHGEAKILIGLENEEYRIQIGGKANVICEYDKSVSQKEAEANAQRIVKAMNMLSNLERLKYVREEEASPHLAIEDRIETAECSLRGWNTVQYKIDMHDALVEMLKKLVGTEDYQKTNYDDFLEAKELLKQAEQK